VENKDFITLFHVDKIYPPNQTALRDIDVRIRKGEFIFIAGASGAGKSTLLKLLFAEEEATRGQVVVGGRNLVTINREQVARLRRSVGVIFQDYKLLHTRPVIENVAYALEVIGVEKRERLQLAYKMLAALGLKERVNSLPRTLSVSVLKKEEISRVRSFTFGGEIWPFLTYSLPRQNPL